MSGQTLFGVLVALLYATSEQHPCSAYTTLQRRPQNHARSRRCAGGATPSPRTSSVVQRKSSMATTTPSPRLLMSDATGGVDGDPTTFVAGSFSRRKMLSFCLGSAGTIILSSLTPTAASARLESVNNPALLPRESGLNVIQVEKFLTTGQANRLDKLLGALERDTGFRVKVLCQNYPNTPGLAIRDYWSLGKEDQKDDKYVVLVVDQFGGRGNVLNFNVGEGVKLALPNAFWTRLQAKFGNTFYVKENGIDLAITNAIDAVVACLRSEEQYCVSVPDVSLSLRSLGM